ncbi:MAG: NUDIX domain-containing protein [Anaerolineae bacterium]|nr:NUDIX domain-containing protein [Anaerolineae bacterium]
MMAALRLGVMCAVLDDDERLLLSRRGDLDSWTVPGGRLDQGESLEAAAVREVAEETGLIVQIERPVGLYYLAGWNRLNILYAGWPLGGELRASTAEARANTFFPAAELPPLPWNVIARDALAEMLPMPRILETSPAERRRVRARLGLRWLKNLLSGRPEPRFPVFRVSAVGVVWEAEHLRLLTLASDRVCSLPRVRCDGHRAPWQQLGERVQQLTGIEVAFQWVGLWQDIARGQIEFVFAATVEEGVLSGSAEWSLARTAALDERDMVYVERVRSTYARDPIWSLQHDGAAHHDSPIVLGEGTHDFS